MKLPEGMTAKTWAIITKLRPDVRDRVLERAAILISEAGLDAVAADERALVEEAGITVQQTLGGV